MSAYIASRFKCSPKGCSRLKDPSRWQSFKDDTSGSIAITFSLVLLLLCMFIGVAVDLSRWSQARHQSATAMDAAVLAGARVLQLDPNNVEGAKLAAQRYYSDNTQSHNSVLEDTPSFAPSADRKAFVGTTHAYIKPAFLSLANVSRLPLTVHAEAVMPNRPLEISMMLDVTGSMSGNKIRDLKTAATDLVDIVIPAGLTNSSVRVAIVPFAEGVRLPSSANTKARGSPAASFTRTAQVYQWGRGWVNTTVTYYRTDCVVERAGNNRYTDAAPGSGNFVMTLYATSSTCGLPAADELVPLTSDRTVLKNKISGLTLSGMTAGQIGTAWAWYTLSPNWNTLWATSSAAKPYNGETTKIAILMTDGEYNQQYDASGLETSATGAGAAANSDSVTQARSLCTSMKAKGIVVYTVGFALGRGSTAAKTLEHCASDSSKAYTPESGAELQQSFRDIALKINQLYLTH